MSKTLGPVYQNHEQIRGAKAEPDDSHDAMKDYLEIAPIPSEENEKTQPQLANNESAREAVSSAPQGILESALAKATKCGLGQSQ